MSEVREKQIANISFQVYFECPHCDADLDLCDSDDCDLANDDSPPTIISILERWWRNEKMEPFEGTCKKCKREFVVDEIEY